MGLESIRYKNMCKDTFSRERVDYSIMSNYEIDYIRIKVFEEWIECVGEEKLKNITD